MPNLQRGDYSVPALPDKLKPLGLSVYRDRRGADYVDVASGRVERVPRDIPDKGALSKEFIFRSSFLG